MIMNFDAKRKPRIVLGACGSVAAMKFGLVLRALSEWAEVKAVVTKTALQFLANEKAESMFEVIFCDDHDWKNRKKIGDSVLHIELAKWADIIVIAPLSAHTAAKIAGGLCDNLLTSIVRAWDYEKPMFVAPSMDGCMWRNPFTEQNFMSIEELGVTLIPPVQHMQTNMREMADPSTISSTVKSFYDSKILKDK
ncbi:putative phosphopantothenoylcysteine decarboxylase [Medicago truncatula]|uniref:phosphopantothenoylcysteine decarboxylase n=2 Tax=Medicago truncatula TaxID=3880 RepID=G7L1E4_MEDTR|nr:phosphopantothenoylcysteine decarboxylase [Medicago truncatula]RHN46817.1 putative phosphopantothenoylcysteine decarboxylase [Medicago truncatula]